MCCDLLWSGTEVRHRLDHRLVAGEPHPRPKNGSAIDVKSVRSVPVAGNIAEQNLVLRGHRLYRQLPQIRERIAIAAEPTLGTPVP